MAFVLVSLSLRIVSAIAAAALLTAKFAIAMEEYSSEELSTVAVCINCFNTYSFFKLSISSNRLGVVYEQKMTGVHVSPVRFLPRDTCSFVVEGVKKR